MCDGVLLSEPNEAQGKFLQVVPNSSAIVKNVLVLQTLILDWKIWNDAPIMVQELLWHALQSLVRSDHRWVSLNILQFKRARVVDKILLALQVLFVIFSIFISRSLEAESLLLRKSPLFPI